MWKFKTYIMHLVIVDSHKMQHTWKEKKCMLFIFVYIFLLATRKIALSQWNRIAIYMFFFQPKTIPNDYFRNFNCIWVIYIISLKNQRLSIQMYKLLQVYVNFFLLSKISARLLNECEQRQKIIAVTMFLCAIII